MAPHPELSPEEAALSPMAVRDLSIAKTIVKRADDVYKELASAGSRDPHDLSGPGYQALFAIIGVGMTLMMIWFFFWAKNGGFKWREDDWEDYKSTVLRRKGPDGKTLSNATKSTRLGGGSVVHGGSYGAESSIGFTDETATSVDPKEYRDAEEGKGGLRGGDGRAHREKRNRRDHTNDYNDPELRHYRHEKAARVGGLNRAADGMYTDYSGSQPSELGSNVSSAPLVKKTEKDPKTEAKAKEMRARERMKKAKAAEKEAARTAAADAKARKEAKKAEAKREKEREKEAYRKSKKTKSEATPSEAPEMAEVTRALTEYTAAYTDYTAPSDVGTPEKKTQSRRAPPSAAYSFTTGDDTNTVYSGAYTDNSPPRITNTASAPKSRAAASRSAPSDATHDHESSYYSDYRPNADPSIYASRTADRTSRSASRPRPAGDRPQGARSRPQSQSPVKKTRPSSSARPSRSGYAPAPPSDIFTATNGDAYGHMSYPCHIPGLSQAGSVGVSESVSQVGGPSSRSRGGRDVMDGYRRGGVRAVGRRDSLSDSD
ncbi:hypothetical protein BDU57DRAFT_469569 [Ampelomyces quisqualis]|uniref:Uncharacterized protein n=1 Tax=Ampelomyces quisqualis TaxID=50730 RepID=A0A6A5QUK1_AMPQU|nr:hypothetical protein BDU57DRAFT_469569 [Ampelomyces quisqualis]